MDKNWDAVFEFEHAKNPTLLKRDEKTDEYIMSWAQRLELIKAQIKEWGSFGTATRTRTRTATRTRTETA